MLTNYDTLVEDIRSLGIVAGDYLNVKMSYKSIGGVDGGVSTVLRALQDVVTEKGLICTDSFVNSYSPLNTRFWTDISTCRSHSYAGLFANYLAECEHSVRSRHPIQRFAVWGNEAELLAKNHTSSSMAYGILYELALRNAKNLKIGSDKSVPGVGTTHVAIELSGFRQKRPISGRLYKDDGHLKMFFRNWSGGCHQAFYNLNKFYDEKCSVIRGKVGLADAKLTSMRETLTSEIKYLRDDPAGFLLCGDPQCSECRYSWEGISEKYRHSLIPSGSHVDFSNLKSVAELARVLTSIYNVKVHDGDGSLTKKLYERLQR